MARTQTPPRRTPAQRAAALRRTSKPTSGRRFPSTVKGSSSRSSASPLARRVSRKKAQPSPAAKLGLGALGAAKTAGRAAPGKKGFALIAGLGAGAAAMMQRKRKSGAAAPVEETPRAPVEPVTVPPAGA